MYSLKIKADINPYKQYEFENAIAQLFDQIESDKSIINCEIKKDLNRNTIYYFEEEWESKKKMQKHFQSESFKSIIGAMKVLGNIIDIKVISTTRKEEINNIIKMEF